MAVERVVIDPFTRVDGHLRIEMEVDNRQVKNAWSQATQFRGIESVVKDRDPRDAWAFVARICGACAGAHSIASITAVENAIDSHPPQQAQLIRDIILAAQEVHDHVIHFYHFHAFDWVNVAAALDADPAKAVEFARSIGSRWKGNTEAQFAQVRDTLRGVWDSGQLSIFSGGLWEHKDYRLPPEANLMAVSHYLDALEFQRSIIGMTTVFGGKNPHPNFLVGGMACSIDPDKSETLNQVQLDQLDSWAAAAQTFATECFYPDVLAMMSAYREYFRIGASWPNFLAAGMSGARFAGEGQRPVSFGRAEVKPAAILDGDFSRWFPLEISKCEEYVSSAWYRYDDGDEVGLNPAAGETEAYYTGPQPPFTWLADQNKYTWSKAPRYDGRAVQVGPIARVISAYVQGHAPTVSRLNDAMDALDIDLAQLNSTAGRTLARAVEAVTTAEYLAIDLIPAFKSGVQRGDFEVFDSSRWEPSSWPKESTGFAMVEVARGLLVHWVSLEEGAISDYQVISPSTWLAGGRDPAGVRGPYEEALAGSGTHPLVDPGQPLEALRTVHSFDPCMACAVHMGHPDEESSVQVV